MPDFYIRYVDDVLAVFRSRAEALSFLDKLNSVHSDPFWLIKETNNLVYTHNDSYSPDSYKNNAIQALYNRSQKLSSWSADREINKNIVRNIFINNGYDPDRINRICQRNDSPKQDKK